MYKIVDELHGTTIYARITDDTVSIYAEDCEHMCTIPSISFNNLIEVLYIIPWYTIKDIG